MYYNEIIQIIQNIHELEYKKHSETKINIMLFKKVYYIWKIQTSKCVYLYKHSLKIYKAEIERSRLRN